MADFFVSLLSRYSVTRQYFAIIRENRVLQCKRFCLFLHIYTDLDAIWPVHLWDPVTLCVRWGSLAPRGRGNFGGQTPQPKHAVGNCTQTIIPMLPGGEYKRGLLWTAILPFAKLLWHLPHSLHQPHLDLPLPDSPRSSHLKECHHHHSHHPSPCH